MSIMGGMMAEGARHGNDMAIVNRCAPCLEDGGRVHYTRTSAGTGYADAVYEHTTTPSRFDGSKMTWQDRKCPDEAATFLPNT
jgi:hypothetical protein